MPDHDERNLTPKLTGPHRRLRQWSLTALLIIAVILFMVAVVISSSRLRH